MLPFDPRWFVLLLLLALPLRAFGLDAEAPERSLQTIHHLLEYVAVEYPQFVRDGKVVDQSEYAEQVEFAGQIKQMIEALPDGAQREAQSNQAAQLLALVRAKADGARVVAAAHQLQADLIALFGIPVAPKRAPDLSHAAALYAARCASCHGLKGDGAGPQASALNPRPTNFQDPKRQRARSVFALFNAITLGVN